MAERMLFSCVVNLFEPSFLAPKRNSDATIMLVQKSWRDWVLPPLAGYIKEIKN